MASADDTDRTDSKSTKSPRRKGRADGFSKVKTSEKNIKNEEKDDEPEDDAPKPLERKEKDK